MKALVTGGTGFVGGAIVRRLAANGWQVRAAVRRLPATAAANCEYVITADLGAGADLTSVAEGCDVVIHTASRVHVMREKAVDALAAYRRANVAGTLELAGAAARHGVRRFVFISSVKVNGESTAEGRPLRETDQPDARGPYAVSKWEAELGLRELCARTGMEYVIIRPPLVYGPGAGANFLSLAKAVKRGVPLPLGAVRNKRSLVGLDNLVDFVGICMQHAEARDETFFVSDGHDLSTPELIRGMAAALGRPARLVSAPGWLLRAGGLLAHRQDAVRRLVENLQVDIDKARQRLAWNPPVAVDEGLGRAMQALLVP